MRLRRFLGGLPLPPPSPGSWFMPHAAVQLCAHVANNVPMASCELPSACDGRTVHGRVGPAGSTMGTMGLELLERCPMHAALRPRTPFGLGPGCKGASCAQSSWPPASLEEIHRPRLATQAGIVCPIHSFHCRSLPVLAGMAG